MTTPDSEPGFTALTSADSGWVNRVAARVGLRVGLYRPGPRGGPAALPGPVLRL